MTLNTKNMVELKEAFDQVVAKWNVDVEYGIGDGHVKLEDGLPWLEVYGKFTKKTAKEFIQELADALNIKMLFNRLEMYGGDDKATLYGVFDLHPDKIDELGKTAPIPAYSDDPDAKEFMEDYGTEILPTSAKTKKNKMK